MLSPEVLRGMTDEELLRSVDRSDPIIKELAERLETSLEGEIDSSFPQDVMFSGLLINCTSSS